MSILANLNSEIRIFIKKGSTIADPTICAKIPFFTIFVPIKLDFYKFFDLIKFRRIPISTPFLSTPDINLSSTAVTRNSKVSPHVLIL